jgi:D-aminopeptidase
MIAWERHIDATRDNPEAIYQRLATPVAFTDGNKAGYGWGLSRGEVLGRPITGHGGGLRGWRSFRFYAPSERMSVVVLFNHFADPRAAAVQLFAAALGETIPTPATGPAIPWVGRYIEPETGLATRIEPLPEGRLALHFSGGPDILAPADGGFTGGTIRLQHDGHALTMTRGTDNLATQLHPVGGAAPQDIAGTYRSAELGADLIIADSGGTMYAACSGELGDGAMVPLIPYATDTWLMPCPRSLDYSPPGDWTLSVQRTGTTITGLRVGCWLARGVDYVKV